MAQRTKKEKQQIAVLGALFGVIILTILYTQRGAFLPSAVPDEDVAAPAARAEITIKAAKALLEEERFTSLEDNVEPRLAPGAAGNPALFAVPGP
jgi:hypothetical protein